jgi:ABC-type lipoprotein release transport system permease subunit
MRSILYLARLRRRRRRFAFVVAALLIAIIGGAVLSTIAGGRRTESAYARLSSETGEANGSVTLDENANAEVPRIVAMPEVRASSRLRLLALSSPTKPDAFLSFVVPLDDHVSNEIERPRIVRGRRADPDQPFEVVLGEARAEFLNVHVGDSFQLDSYTPPQINQLGGGETRVDPAGPSFTLQVVGIERSARHIISDAGAEGEITVLTPAFTGAVSGEVGSYAEVLILRVPESGVPSIVRRLASTPGLQQLSTQFTTSKRVVDAIDLVARGLYAFALLSAISGLVALVLFLARRISANLDDDDALAAIGLTRNERRAAAVLELLPAIACGAVGALGAAVVVSAWMPFGLAGRIEPRPGVDVDWKVLVPGGSAVVVACIVLTAVVAWSTIGTGRPATRRVPIASRVVELLGARPVGAAGLRLALERGRGKRAIPVGTALAGAVLAIAGVTGALVFGASLQRMLDEPQARGWTWDVIAQDDRSAPHILADPEVAHVTAARISTLTINDRTVEFRGLQTLRGNPPDIIVDGRAPTAVDEVALGAETMRALHLGVDDRVRATGPVGSEELRVVGRAVFAGMSDDAILADGAVVTEPALRRLVPPETDKPEEDASFTEYTIEFAGGLDTTAAAERLEERLAAEGYGIKRPTAPSELRRLRDVRAIPWVLAGFVGLLAVISVGYAMVTAVQRRRPELAMHKTMGITRGGVLAIVLVHATTTLAIGVGVGLPLGLLTGRALWRLQSDNLGTAFVFVAPVATLAVMCASALVLANLCSLLPATRAARTHPAVALRTE